MAKREVPENKKQSNAEAKREAKLATEEKIKFWGNHDKYSDLNSDEIQTTFSSVNDSLKGDENVVEAIKLIADYPDGGYSIRQSKL